MSLYFSSKHCQYPGDKGLTITQKEQIYRCFKKYALDTYRSEEKKKNIKFDGQSAGLFSSPRKCVVSIYYFFYSPFYKNMALASKMANPDFAFRTDDRKAIVRKTATLLRSAGYKVELSAGDLDLKIWKPTKK